MGNTDSAHDHLDATADGAHHHHFDSAPSTLQYTHHRKSSHNLQSHHHHQLLLPDKENGSLHHQPTSIKVLPKLNENPPPGLRTTNNGLILHNGGTLSARRDQHQPSQAPPPLPRFVASRPPVGPPTTARALGGIVLTGGSSNKPPSLLTGLPPLMKRSRTQHDMLTPSASSHSASGANGWAANSRRYHHNQQLKNGGMQTSGGGGGGGSGAKSLGSESDLLAATRIDAQASQSMQQPGGLTSSHLKAISRAHALQPLPPAPPLLPSPKKYSAPQPPTAFVAPVPRKMRMFKTKAESRKNSSSTTSTSTSGSMIAGGGASPTAAASVTAPMSQQQQSASTEHLSGRREPTLLGVRRSQSPLARYPRHPLSASTWDTNTTNGAMLPRIGAQQHQHSAAQMQANYFRREKSFDLNLLRAHHAAAAAATASADAAATDSTSGSMPLRSEFQQELMAATERKHRDVTDQPQRSRLPVARSRQMQQPQLLGMQSVDKVVSRAARSPVSMSPHISQRVHVPADDENNNHSGHVSAYALTTCHPHSEAVHSSSSILDEYLTKSIQLDAISRFTETLQQQHHVPTPAERYMSPPIVDDMHDGDDDFDAHTSSTSATSSSSGDGDAGVGIGRGNASDTTASSCLSFRGDSDPVVIATKAHITITVRPTLPRRQFDIPRFNPAEAWRSLNDVPSNGHSSAATQPAVNFSREAAPIAYAARAEEHLVRPVNRYADDHQQQHVLYDSSRSAESGISSGEDVHPSGAGDTKDPIRASIAMPSTWTPQQDLGDDDDDDNDIEMLIDCTAPDADDHDGRTATAAVVPTSAMLEHFYPEVTDNITRSRQRNHCSMFSLSLPRDTHMTSSTTDDSGPLKPEFSSLKKTSGRETTEPYESPVQSGDNWLLSSSAPNSLEFIAAPGGICGRPAADRQRSQVPPLLASCAPYTAPPMSSIKYFSSGPHVMCLPAVAVDAAADTNRSPANGTVQACTMPPSRATSASTAATHHRLATKINHHHRFTFQSTVRQIERRRLAERLSHEAAAKEAQRRNELESMQRVEEEFQRKRSREKTAAMLKQQQQKSYQSLPTAASSDRNNNLTEDEAHYRYNDYEPTATTNPVDTHSPYIGRLIEQKSAGRVHHNADRDNLMF